MPLPTPIKADETIERLRDRLAGIDIATRDLELYRTDIFYESPHLPVAVVSPRSAADVQRIVKAALQLGLSLASRGAGLSYSAGYIPTNDHTLIVDTTRMNRIVELNVEDRYVTVEAGVTWAALYEALKGTGVISPFWGTFSGRHATVGAALSQGAKFYGSGFRGTSAETVVGLKVVTGDGEVVTTGSAASIHRPTPFYRNYGPDLTGMFLADSGAFGIKVEATLQLIPAAEAIEVASFSFADADGLLRSMGTIGAEALATESYALDPTSVRGRLSRKSVGDDLQALKSVAAAASSPLKGLKDAVSVAVGGRGFAENIGYLLNCVTEGRTQSEAASRMERVREIVRTAGAVETKNSIPRVMRANPFPEVSGLLTPTGKRINWLHTVVPNSRAVECFNETEAVYQRHRVEIDRFQINWGYFLTTNGPSGVGIETLINWSDAPLPIHDHYMKSAGNYVTKPADHAAREAVATITKDIIRRWSEIGAVHLQIGKKYPYFETREPATRLLVEQFKQLVDPHGIFNPGNLLPEPAEAGTAMLAEVLSHDRQ
jgi:FAD/FMN-containing dehydrogenase